MEIKDLLQNKEDFMKAVSKIKDEGGVLAKLALENGKKFSGDAKKQYEIIALKAKIEKAKYDIGSIVVELGVAKAIKDNKLLELLEKIKNYNDEIAAGKKSTTSSKKGCSSCGSKKTATKSCKKTTAKKKK